MDAPPEELEALEEDDEDVPPEVDGLDWPEAPEVFEEELPGAEDDDAPEEPGVEALELEGLELEGLEALEAPEVDAPDSDGVLLDEELEEGAPAAGAVVSGAVEVAPGAVSVVEELAAGGLAEGASGAAAGAGAGVAGAAVSVDSFSPHAASAMNMIKGKNFVVFISYLPLIGESCRYARDDAASGFSAQHGLHTNRTIIAGMYT